MVEPRTGIDAGPTSYSDPGFSRFLRRAYLASGGLDEFDLDRPVVGIANTTSDYNPCHRQMPELVEAVRRGVLEAGGIPFVFPTMSLGETLLSPTSMLFRNLMAMETEELIRAQPMDAVVLLGGCDKTVPAQLMAAASADVPALIVPTGPMLTTTWRGDRVGACTDCRRFWGRHRAGSLSADELADVQSNIASTAGTCAVMGTAATMACLAEALGMSLAGAATAPAATGERLRIATQSGRQAVALATAPVRPSEVMSDAAMHNAVTVLSAISGSTNAVVHLLAIAGRLGRDLPLGDFDRISRLVPLLVDCRPSGMKFVEDFHRAGGMLALLKTLEPVLRLDAVRVDGRTVGDLLAAAEGPQPWQDTIRGFQDPIAPSPTLAVLRGSLAPDGAIIKVAAASRHLLNHVGPAIVFESAEAAAISLSDPNLEVTADHVLVLRNVGPVAAGMPEAAYMGIPIALARQGVTDIVRVSDGRMSGTAFGTVALHCAPEAAVGGPLALVQTGDMIKLDVDDRRLDLLVDEPELERRRHVLQGPALPVRGWAQLYAREVMQADQGADLRFLRPAPARIPG